MYSVNLDLEHCTLYSTLGPQPLVLVLNNVCRNETLKMFPQPSQTNILMAEVKFIGCERGGGGTQLPADHNMFLYEEIWPQ